MDISNLNIAIVGAGYAGAAAAKALHNLGATVTVYEQASEIREVGAGIGTMSRKLVHTSDLVIGVEPNANCVARLGAAMNAEPKFTVLPCHLEECDLGALRLEQLEAAISQKMLEKAAKDRMRSGAADRAPDRYQRAVDDYFRSLASRP